MGNGRATTTQDVVETGESKIHDDPNLAGLRHAHTTTPFICYYRPAILCQHNNTPHKKNARAHRVWPHLLLLLLWRLLRLLSTKHTALLLLLHKLLLLRARLRLRLRCLRKQSTTALLLWLLRLLRLLRLRVGPLVARLGPGETLRWLDGAHCCRLGSGRRDGQRLEGSNKPAPGTAAVSETAAHARARCRGGGGVAFQRAKWRGAAGWESQGGD